MREPKTRIAYLTGEYPRATDTFIQREIMALRALGHEVETCSVRKTGVEHLVGPEQRAEAAKTFYIVAAAKSPMRFVACHGKAFLRSPKRYAKALRLALTSGRPGLKGLLFQLFYFAEAAVLADHLRRKSVTHLHNHIAKSSCSLAMITAEMSGIPFSFTLHGPDIFFAPEEWRLDLKIAKARFVACISHFCRSQAMAFSQASQWHKLHIVHCGIEPERYAPQSGRPASQNLVFIGRMSAVKGVPVLLNAMAGVVANVPEARLVMIGDGPDRAALEQDVRVAGLDGIVDFVGYKSQDEVAQILAQSDALVLPSFAEGVPVVLMEAMAAGLPVVATRIAGIPELVEDGISGFVVAPGDEDTLSEAITTLLGNQDLRDQMGQQGRAKVCAEFNLTTEAGWLSEILTSYAVQQPVTTLRPSKHEGDA